MDQLGELVVSDIARFLLAEMELNEVAVEVEGNLAVEC